MNKIFNQEFINLDELIDLDGLMYMKPKISAFIANNGALLKPVKYPNGCLFDRSLQGIQDLQKQFETNPDCYKNKEIIKHCIENDTFGSYIIYENDNVVQGSYSLNLRYPKDYKNKHRTTACQAINQDILFDFFYQWLNRQNIFSEYGRVNFFVTHKGSRTEVHRDYINPNSDLTLLTPDQHNYISDLNEPEQFILINFTTRKKFFLYDSLTNSKTYIPGTCNWFDASNFHGTDAVDQACYSLRIDGIFSKEFYTKITNKYLAVGTGVEPVTTA